MRVAPPEANFNKGKRNLQDTDDDDGVKQRRAVESTVQSETFSFIDFGAIF